MTNNLNRRSFLKTGALLGAGSLIGGNALSGLVSRTSDLFAMDKIDLSVVQGDNYYASTIKAVEKLGGMKKFVKAGSKVGLLVNSRHDKPATFVKPEIALAVLNMCIDAGAQEIISLENVTSSYWKFSSLSEKHSEKIAQIKQAGSNFIKVSVPGAICLKEAEVEKAFLDCDVLINVAIFKDHEGIKQTGILKNYMGFTSNTTNRFFHFGSNKGKGWFSDLNFLAQCIADINLLKKSDLCIGDATEFITTNGPSGPGNISKLKKVVASADRVAIDAYGTEALGLKASDILHIKKAYDFKLGEMDLSKLKVKEVKV